MFSVASKQKQTNKKSFLDLSFSFHIWINGSFNPARHCRKSTLIFSSAMPPWLWLLPRGWGRLDVSCRYLIAVYNTQRGPGQIRGQGWAADPSMKESGCCESRLKQGSAQAAEAGNWWLLVVFSRFQAEKIREFCRNILCSIRQLLSDLLLCFEEGRMFFWKTLTAILLGWFYQPEELDKGWSCLTYRAGLNSSFLTCVGLSSHPSLCVPWSCQISTSLKFSLMDSQKVIKHSRRGLKEWLV